MGNYSVKLSEIVEYFGFDIVCKASNYDNIEITTANITRPGLQLAGYFDYFESNRIQLMGQMESSYMLSLMPEERELSMRRLLDKKIPALILCHGIEPDEDWKSVPEECDVTVLKTDSDTSEILAMLTSFLRDRLAPRLTRAGVFVEIYGEGMLIQGESGVGKSEAALELIKRGHILIADDAVEIKRISGKKLIGSSPELIRYYMELRGVGIIDVRSTFGTGAVKEFGHINMVVMLEEWKENKYYDRLGTDEKTMNILGVDLPYLTIPIKPGRNIAVILEIAAMNNRQKKMGYNSAREFTDKINRHFDELERK